MFVLAGQAQAHQHGGKLFVRGLRRAAAAIADMAFDTAGLNKSRPQSPLAIKGDGRNPAAFEMAASLQEYFAFAVSQDFCRMDVGFLVGAIDNKPRIGPGASLLGQGHAGQANHQP